MREVKYRAWVEKEKELVDVITIYFEDRTVTLPIQTSVIAEEWWDKTTWNFEDVVLMQSTGLKDKNGREIYEGDIVKNVGPYSPTVRKYGFGEFKYTNENLVVCKELVGTTLRHIIDFKTQNELPNGLTGMSPNGWYGPKPPIDNEQFWNFQRSFEVIGNIYENPELLEVNK